MAKANRKHWVIIDRLADLILKNVDGCIVEIGIGASTQVLVRFAEIFDRTLHSCDCNQHRCDWAREYVKSPKLQIHFCKSLEFISEFTEVPAIVFIDGCHNYKVMREEVLFFIQKLATGGVMFIHDTCPLQATYEAKLSKGKPAIDTWQIKEDLKKIDFIDFFTWPYTAGDCGLTMIIKKDMNGPFYRL